MARDIDDEDLVDDDDADDPDDAEDTLSLAALGAQLRLLGATVVALLLAGPSLIDVVYGRQDLETAAWRFLLVFLGARVAASIVWGVYASCRRQQDEAARRAMLESIGKTRQSN